jgi:hypothetical protein
MFENKAAGDFHRNSQATCGLDLPGALPAASLPRRAKINTLLIFLGKSCRFVGELHGSNPRQPRFSNIPRRKGNGRSQSQK